MSQRKLVDEGPVLAALGLPDDDEGRAHLARLRMQRKIPYFKWGHRTIKYDLEAVLRAVERFEVKAVA